MKHRMMSLFLCGLILYFSFSEIAFAGNVQENTCTHEHTDACYAQVTACLYAADSPDSAHGEDGTDTGETEQEHICSEESGCITRILLCPHVHDEQCGYFGVPEPVPVLSWEWIDEEEYLTQDENTDEWGLGLPGASEENPVTAEVLAELLPAEITAVFSDKTTKTLPIEWDYTPLPKNGAYEGAYTLSAALPEEYTLNADAPELTVLLELGGGETMAVSQADLDKHIVTEGVVNPPDATVNLFDYAVIGTVTEPTTEQDILQQKNCWHYRNQDQVFKGTWGIPTDARTFAGFNDWNIGINKNHFILFGDAQIVHGGLWNRGGGASGPYGQLFAGMQGMVNNTLTDGYPTINAENAVKKLDGTSETFTYTNPKNNITRTYQKWMWVTDALLAGDCQGTILYANIDQAKASVQNISKTIINNWQNATGKTFGTGAGESTESLEYLFKPGNDNDYKKSYEDVTGLFQMDNDGYYYYSMRNNFAQLSKDADGNNKFILYDAPATLTSDNSGNVGNFLPFNTGIEVFSDVTDGKLESKVSCSEKGINHYFGLSLDLDFRQPVNGKVNSHNQAKDMIFEFSGDDDVWVFIDDTLVLDLGGVHSEIYGTINFATGEVNIGRAYDEDGKYAGIPANPKESDQNNINTTLKKLFTEAGMDDKVRWNGNTFASNTDHTLRFFYLERGNYDSSMTLRFNLTSKLFQQIKKVDQDGKPLENVQFQLYAAQKVEGTESEYVPIGDVLTTLTTKADGLAQFVEKASITASNPDGDPFNFADRYTNGTQFYILHESVTPDGYRELPKDIVLKYEPDTAMLVVENPWVTGAYASFTSTVTGNKNITYGKLNTDTCDIESDGGNLEAAETVNGLVVAVPMLFEEETQVWKALYGSNVAGFSAVKPEERTEADWRKAVLTALLYQCSDTNENTPGWYLQWVQENNRFEGTLSDLPGRADRYRLNNASGDMKMVYAIISPSALHALGISTAAGTGAAKYEQLGAYVNSLMTERNWTRDEAVAAVLDEILDSSNGFRFLNTDQFSRSFRSLIYIPNEQRELRVWKVGEDGKGVNGAEFTLYKDLACTQVAAAGVTGSVGDRDGVLIFTPSPEKENDAVKSGYAEIRWAASQHNTYYLQETQAPTGYTVNPTVIPVHVGTYSIYADAGTSDNGITVMAGVGKLAQTMKKYAADNEVNITLRDITAAAQIQPTGAFNPDGWMPVKLDGTDELRSMNLHYGINALVNYGLHNEDGGQTLYPYFVTDTGFITARVKQNYSALDGTDNKYESDNTGSSANKTLLGDTDITSLFSLLNVVVVTDQKESESESKTGGLTISKTIIGEIGPDENDEYFRNFAFKLELTHADGTPFDTAEKFYFYGTDKSGYISSGGNILLHHDESMTILGLPEGTRYRVTEALNAEDGYTSIGGVVREGIIYAEEEGRPPAAAEFVNARGKNVPFAFRKVDALDLEKPLSGARFAMYWWSGEGDPDTASIPLTGAPVNSGWTSVGTAVSDANGLVDFGSLAEGTYRLIETAAPGGYILPQAQWQISVVVENGLMVIKEVSTVGVVDDKQPPAFAKAETTIGGVTTLYKLPNISDVTLPFTGGRQAYRYMMFGAGLFCTAAGFAVWYCARGDRKKSRVKKC